MTEPGDYCELCDLPLSQCVHGQPAPPVEQPPPRTPRKPRASRAAPRPATQVTTRVARRRTAPEDFKPFIVTVLREAGGESHVDEVMAGLAEQMADVLRPADHELSPQGEVRWQYAARLARKQLVDEGVMRPAQRPGLWHLR